MSHGPPTNKLRRPAIVYGAGSLLAAVLPVLARPLPGFEQRLLVAEPLLSMFAVLQALVVCLTLYLVWSRSSGQPSVLWDIGCAVAVSLFFLGIIAEYPARTWDWRAYQGAALAVARGGNPYTEADYLYPPVLAQVGAAVTSVIRPFAASAADVPRILFYLWQCLQFHVVMLCYALSRLLWYRVGLPNVRWTIALAALFVLNTPLLRALRFSQPALCTLAAALMVILWADSRPWLVGLSVAAAAYVKVFPAILLLPALLAPRRKLLAWSAVWVLVIGLASLVAPGGRDYWTSFLNLLRAFPEPLAFRDNSVPGLVRNAARVLQVVPPSPWVARALQIGIVLWLVGRMIARRTRAGLAEGPVWLGNVSDALCLGLLLSPTAWEHYFVFVIPAIVWGWRASLTRRPITVGLATVLTSLVPVFDVFPFSYHRLAGLILLIVAIPLPTRCSTRVGADRES